MSRSHRRFMSFDSKLIKVYFRRCWLLKLNLRLAAVRMNDNEEQFDCVYSQAMQVTGDNRIEQSCPRFVERQRNRGYVPHSTRKEYY